MQITKGKWNWKFRTDMDIDTNIDYIIFLEPNKEDEIARAYAETNARLIAAAPELYEAVCDLLDYAYEALHLAGGENETRGKAPRILREIQEYQQLIDRVNGKEGA